MSTSRAHRPSRAARRDGPEPNVAVVRLPDLPLQILLRDRPEFVGKPAAVVAGEGPEAILTHVSRPAIRAGLRVGMPQGVARDRVPELHTGVIDGARIEEIETKLAKGLGIVSPKVEPCVHFPATFYLDPTGMGRLFGGPSPWAASVNAYLRGRGLFGSVVVGFHRYRAYAIAGVRLGTRVFESIEDEHNACLEVDLHTAGLPPALCEDLAMLDIRTVGALLSIPGSELGGRFGGEAARFRALLAPHGEMQLPLQPLGFEEPTEAHFEVHPPDRNAHRLIFGVRGALHPLVGKLEAKGEWVRRVRIIFELDAPEGQQNRVEFSLEPATATNDVTALIELLRLRMSSLALPWPVERAHLHLESERAVAQATALPGHRPTRDLEAAARALARIRAAHGPRAVVRAHIRDAHLPEGRFKWEPTIEVKTPRATGGKGIAGDNKNQTSLADWMASTPSADGLAEDLTLGGNRPLIRRLGRPTPLRSARPRGGLLPGHTEIDTMPMGPEGESVCRLFGPYRISGGWWKREIERDYYYAETAQGALLWVFWDRNRRQWFLHGRVD